MANYQSFIICTSPRSGSTLLCKLLAATGKSGKPDSHFHSPSIVEWARYYKIPDDGFPDEHDLLEAIFRAARDRGTGNTGIFGLRLQRPSADFFMQKLSVLCNSLTLNSDAERILNVFGNTLFIHLSRYNKLDQSISLLKARQTGLWHKAPDDTELDRTTAHRDPIYDSRAIARHLAELTDMDAHWESWFHDQGLEPLHISYDDLSDNPTDVLAVILGQLGLRLQLAEGIDLPVAKLADETNKLWAKLFLSEKV